MQLLNYNHHFVTCTLYIVVYYDSRQLYIIIVDIGL